MKKRTAMDKIVDFLNKLIFGHTYRIVKMDVPDTLKDNPFVFRYKIEERYNFMGIFHFWGTPEFTPPHMFHDIDEAIDYIKGHTFLYKIEGGEK